MEIIPTIKPVEDLCFAVVWQPVLNRMKNEKMDSSKKQQIPEANVPMSRNRCSKETGFYT